MRRTNGVVMLAAWLAVSCAPRKFPPAGDTSALPDDVLAAFRREDPNAVITSVGKSGDEWRIEYFTQTYKRKTVYYNAAGDKLRPM